MSLEDVLEMIKIWNALYAGKAGSGGMDISKAIAVADLIQKASWMPITNGQMIGGRYFVSDFGIITQMPKPSNEMSLVSETVAKMLGVIS